MKEMLNPKPQGKRKRVREPNSTISLQDHNNITDEMTCKNIQEAMTQNSFPQLPTKHQQGKQKELH